MTNCHTTTCARDSKAVLAVHGSKLFIHGDRVCLLQLRVSRLIRERGLPPELSWVNVTVQFVISLLHGLCVEAVHVNIEHLEQICAVLQALHCLWHWPVVLLALWDRDRLEHIQVVLG